MCGAVGAVVTLRCVIGGFTTIRILVGNDISRVLTHNSFGMRIPRKRNARHQVGQQQKVDKCPSHSLRSMRMDAVGVKLRCRCVGIVPLFRKPEVPIFTTNRTRCGIALSKAGVFIGFAEWKHTFAFQQLDCSCNRTIFLSKKYFL